MYLGFLSIYQIILSHPDFILPLVNDTFFKLENDFAIYVRFGELVNVIVGLTKSIE